MIKTEVLEGTKYHHIVDAQGTVFVLLEDTPVLVVRTVSEDALEKDTHEKSAFNVGDYDYLRAIQDNEGDIFVSLNNDNRYVLVNDVHESIDSNIAGWTAEFISTRWSPITMGYVPSDNLRKFVADDSA